MKQAAISVEDIREAVEALKANAKKPVWGFTWKFPFIERVWIHDPKQDPKITWKYTVGDKA